MIRKIGMLMATLAAAGLLTAVAPAYHASASVTCSGTGCNGLDPIQTGCGGFWDYPDDSQRVSDLEALYNLNTGNVVGHVWLDYSAACNTNWIEGEFNDRNPNDGSWVESGVYGTTSHGTYGDGPVPFTYYGTGEAFWGNMIYSPGCSWGFIDRHNSDYSIHIGGQAVQDGCPSPT